MTEAQFWETIDASRDADEDRQLQKLGKHLQKLSTEQIVAFENTFRSVFDRAYRHDLWGAAYVINGGCSDDGFMDFRYWLIAQGSEVYQAASKEPDCLADHIKVNDAAFEDFAYVAADVYEKKADNMLPDYGRKVPTKPAGEPWKEEDLTALFPRLTKRVAELEQ